MTYIDEIEVSVELVSQEIEVEVASDEIEVEIDFIGTYVGGIHDVTYKGVSVCSDGIAIIPQQSKADVGLGNVDNTSDLDKPISTATQGALNLKADSSAIPTALSDLSEDSTHRTVTDAEKTAWNNKIDVVLKGASNGVAELDANGHVPANQLPPIGGGGSTEAYTIAGATPLSAGWLSLVEGGPALNPGPGIIYVVLSDGDYLNKIYRWTGSAYIELSSRLELGYTNDKACPGSIGYTGYNHSTRTDNPHKVTAEQVGFTMTVRAI